MTDLYRLLPKEMEKMVIDMGYDTHNSIMNLGSVALIFYIYIALLLILLLLHIIAKLTGMCKELVKKL